MASNQDLSVGSHNSPRSTRHCTSGMSSSTGSYIIAPLCYRSDKGKKVCRIAIGKFPFWERESFMKWLREEFRIGTQSEGVVRKGRPRQRRLSGDPE